MNKFKIQLPLSNRVKKFIFFLASIAYLICLGAFWDYYLKYKLTFLQDGKANWGFFIIVLIPALGLFSKSIDYAKKHRQERHVKTVLSKYKKSH